MREKWNFRNSWRIIVTGGYVQLLKRKTEEDNSKYENKLLFLGATFCYFNMKW